MGLGCLLDTLIHPRLRIRGAAEGPGGCDQRPATLEGLSLVPGDFDICGPRGFAGVQPCELSFCLRSGGRWPPFFFDNNIPQLWNLARNRARNLSCGPSYSLSPGSLSLDTRIFRMDDIVNQWTD